MNPRKDATHFPPSPLVVLHQVLRDRRELYVARALVDGADLAVAEVLLREPLSHEPHAAHPLDGLAGHPSRDLGGEELRHGRVGDEGLAGLLLARGVVDEVARGLQLGVGLRELVLHGLEGADKRAELLALVPHVRCGVVEGAPGEARHLRGDADAALVEDRDGVLITGALLAEQVAVRDLDVVEVDDAGRRGADAELLLLLGDAEAGGVARDDEGGDALVALVGGQIGEDEEEAGLYTVRDPHLGPVDLVARLRLGGARL